MTGFVTRALVSGALLVSASAGFAQTGSGSVQFEFLGFSGPVQSTTPSNPGDPPFLLTSLVNGVTPTLTGQSVASGNGAQTWQLGSVTFAGGTTGVEFGYSVFDPSSIVYNRISFAPTSFSNVAPGQDFTLGTITFQNGGWFGGGATSLQNVTSLLPFRVWTSSSDGSQFNQQRFGIITLTVNVVPDDGGFDPANFDAEADWITVFMGDDPSDTSSWIEVADFRVYDNCCKPSGLTNTGTVDLEGKFGSLILTSLANPVGGFIAGTNEVLPPGTIIGGGGGGGVTPGVIPEPAAWAMMIAGFGLVGGMMRRRREALAA